MSNEKKSQTLGMPHGTAVHRLRKRILFHLCRLNENKCVRCEKEIESDDDLSIEHIKPWEGISSELFWDLNNISFSHLKCNVRGKSLCPSPLRKVGPEGTSWCSSCNDFLPIDNFYKSKERWHGYFNKCKECYARVRKEYPSRENLKSVASECSAAL